MSTPVDHYEVRYRRSDTVGAWTTLTLPPGSTSVSIAGVVRGYTYQVEARSVGTNGAVSQWIQQTHTAAYATYLAPGQVQAAIGSGSVIGESFADGTAAVVCNPFTTSAGVVYFPSGEQTISGLQQQQRYYVYVVDQDGIGGDLTPVATTNQADYLGMAGYQLIDTVVTPYAASGTGNTSITRYYPSSYTDTGNRTTLSPQSAYDGDLYTGATVSSSAKAVGANPIQTFGIFTLSGFTALVLTAPATLTVVASANIVGGGTAHVSAYYGGSQSGVVMQVTATTGQHAYTLTLPPGTDLSSLRVQAAPQPGTPSSGQTTTVSLQMIETYVSV